MSKSVLITGGSRGIGAACVRLFAAKGYKTAFFYKQSIEQAEALSRETGAVAVQCDIASPEEVGKAVNAAKVYLGISHFDTLVCNAGISINGLFMDMTHEQWKNIIDVNLNGYIYAIEQTLPSMVSAGHGQIVTISSMWGQTGASCEVAYSTTKAAVIGLTKALAKETGPSKVRVNCVAPGVIDTEMNSEYSDEVMRGLADEVPLGTIGTPEDVAKTVFFLSSEESEYITGQVIGVNGGFLI